MKIAYLGQNGFILTGKKVKIGFDLYLSDSVYKLTGSGKRNYNPPFLPEEINDLTYLFISHNHLDHLDPETIPGIATASASTIFVCPCPYVDVLAGLGVERTRIIGAKAYEELKLGDLVVYPIPEKHEEYTLIDGEHGNLGYVVLIDGMKVFHAGDAIADRRLAEDIKRYGRMNVMFLPINGHDWKRFENDIMGNMNYREALDLCDYVGADIVVPMHYDLFDNNTENPAYFVDYLYKTYPSQRFKMFMPKEEIIYEGKSEE